ncbi:hypothetical protein LOAG_02986 [Loa loa]|uniref:Uncharacterized protein n=1 Tax=Loa loa TaxID=7209 RepID=A0A1S0U5G5_LOALO|nr:hypothetical protein LOAG_02986 [Loa loa]EFO25496.1 hypothetical protein LOAG_02986 [Loa loa]
MLKYFSQEKHEFVAKDREMVKINNSINCLKKQIAYAKIRSRKNHEIINKFRDRLLYLCDEFYDTKRLFEGGKKINTPSVSADTDYIIDLQNELKTTENKIQLLRDKLNVCQRHISELRIQLVLTDQKVKQSEKDKAQLQILCAKAEITSLQCQIQENREGLF